jgi:hypothetical protein
MTAATTSWTSSGTGPRLPLQFMGSSFADTKQKFWIRVRPEVSSGSESGFETAKVSDPFGFGSATLHFSASGTNKQSFLHRAFVRYCKVIEENLILELRSLASTVEAKPGT